ncbi:MAG: hypothetical protein LC754_10605 [Acidobacteria bacterium]|nr:hypothetical protein [Acidobacteriota bacterium]
MPLPHMDMNDPQNPFKVIETPLTDELEAWWRPEMYMAYDYADNKGHYCVIGAIGALMYESQDEAHNDQWRTLLERARGLIYTNDNKGHAAAINHLRMTEYNARMEGAL